MRILWLIPVAICCVFPLTFTKSASSEPIKFDEFGDICCGYEKAKLDAFSVELMNNPEAQGYIIFYGGRRYPTCYNPRPRIPRRREAQARADRMMPYLINQRGFDEGRIVMINGGYRESWMAELWIVPKDATPPVPTPTLRPNQIRFRKGRVTRREFRLQCDEG